MTNGARGKRHLGWIGAAVAAVSVVVVIPNVAPAAPVGAAGTFTAVAPTRILDTRINQGLAGAFAASQVRSITVTGGAGVPASGVDAIALNVTVTEPSAAGYLTVFPAGASLPGTSSLNFAPAQTVPNLVVVKVGTGGKVSLKNGATGTTQVVADVVGWYSDGTTAAGNGFTALNPTRVLDTRSNVGLPGKFAANQVRTLHVPGIPAGTDAVTLNVTVTNPASPGFLTLFPANQAVPMASNLNFVGGQTVANLVIAKVDASGNVGIANTAVASGTQPTAGSVDVVADLVGYFDAAGTGALTSIAPRRVLDTRTGSGTPVGPNATITVDPNAGSGLPTALYDSVVVNVTVTQPTAAGHLTVYPSDANLPLASNLNFTAGGTVANLAMARVGLDGKLQIANTRVPTDPQPSAGWAHIIVDLVGYFTKTRQPCSEPGTPPAQYDHVIWIWMENHQATQVIGSASAPYETLLASQCGTASDYESVGSPSLPNYIGATSGSNQGITDDAPPSSHPLTVDNLFRQVRAKGLSERSYQEAMPSACAQASSGRYAVKHNPAPYYTGGSDGAACQADDVPLGTVSSGALRSDLDAGTLPAFAFVTPDLCNDTHDCPVATGDAWLQQWVPQILAKAGPKTAVFIVWDEPTPMPFIAIAPTVPHGAVVSPRVDHFALLRTTEEMLGITPYLGAASNAPSMRSALHL
jgi:hypothetical protein